METSIVIPAHNEEGCIGTLLRDLIELREKEGLDFEIIVVNDNSSDNTGRISEKFSNGLRSISVIHRKKGKNGIGYALWDGTKNAKGDIIIWLMGDGCDSLKTIPEIVKKINEGYDMIIGSRYMNGGSRGDLPFYKFLLSSGYSFVSRLIFGIPIHDITNAFRGFRKEIFEKIEIEAGDFTISPEFTIKTHLKGYRLGEVPTSYKNRVVGESKFNVMSMGVRYIKLFRYKLAQI